MVTLSFEDKLYPPAKIMAVVDLLSSEGISSTDALRGLDLSFEALQESKTRVSVNQVIESYRNAIRLSRDRHFPFHLGLNQRISAYGLYGFAMLCCPNIRRTLEFAVRYHPLATPTCSILFEEQANLASWVVEPVPHPRIDAATYRFVTELQIGIHISLMRDVEPSFVPSEVALAYLPGDSEITEGMAQCRVRYGQPRSRIIFGSAWLDQTPTQGHRTTYPEILAMCDRYLADLTVRTGPAGRVRQILLRDLAKGTTIADTARALGTTTRTLRRQLDYQGTSFRQLADELRSHLAVQYLRETTMKNEDIGVALGFSDNASFRRAFSRWTGKSPNAFRRHEDPCEANMLNRGGRSDRGRKHASPATIRGTRGAIQTGSGGDPGKERERST
jgi:AraC-like DNA-binding protein